MIRIVLALAATLALSGCLKLPDLLSLADLIPTTAETCAMSPATRAELVALMNTTEAAFAAACEIAN